MKILIVTDASPPQINGVVRTYEFLEQELKKLGHQVVYINNSSFFTIPLFNYPEIRIACNIWKIGKLIEKYKADIIHIATVEGPIGLAAALYCKKHHIPFTTAYHTRFPEFVKTWFPWLSINWLSNLIRKIHHYADCIMVTTPSMKDILVNQGYDESKLKLWIKGVDTDLFHSKFRLSHERPIKLVCVSRITKEKNLDDFLSLDMSTFFPQGYELIMIGDGPLYESYKDQYRNVTFLGYQTGSDLAYELANSDVFVFPSKLDTLGLVMLESMSCGTPVAAYPVIGPKDIIQSGINGITDTNLAKACFYAINISRKQCRDYTIKYFSWAESAKQFIDNSINKLKKIDIQF